MAVLSIRFSDAAHHERLRSAASRAGTSLSPLAEELIEEGLRMRDHPRVVFREGPYGRRPALASGPEIIDVIGAIVGGDVPKPDRRARAAEILAISPSDVDAALGYYAEFTEEIDRSLEDRRARSAELEARWRKGQQLLGS